MNPEQEYQPHITPEMADAGVQAYSRWLCEHVFEVDPDTWRDHLTKEQYIQICQGIEKAYHVMRKLEEKYKEWAKQNLPGPTQSPGPTAYDKLSRGECIEVEYSGRRCSGQLERAEYSWVSFLPSSLTGIKDSFRCQSCKKVYHKHRDDYWTYNPLKMGKGRIV